MKLTKADEAKLKTLHPDLVRVVRRLVATSTVQFTILETSRTLAQQKKNVAHGVSQTLRSRHIPGKAGFACAVDIAPLVDGKVSWAWPMYYKLAPQVKAAALAEKVPVEWGGDWKSFKDGPHWQLPWKQYP